MLLERVEDVPGCDTVGAILPPMERKRQIGKGKAYQEQRSWKKSRFALLFQRSITCTLLLTIWIVTVCPETTCCTGKQGACYLVDFAGTPAVLKAAASVPAEFLEINLLSFPGLLSRS